LARTSVRSSSSNTSSGCCAISRNQATVGRSAGFSPLRIRPAYLPI
jgi:hypothetical protein